MFRNKILYGLVAGSTVLSVYMLVHAYRSKPEVQSVVATALASQYGWVLRLLVNCLGYATVLLPMFLTYRYLHNVNYFDKPATSSFKSRILFMCFSDPSEKLPETARLLEEGSPRSERQKAVQLVGCFLGLMASYLVWGLLQEKIMTQNYMLADGTIYKFSDSQFLVFMNRVCALVLSLIQLSRVSPGAGASPGGHSAPLYKFSYCALTNIVSAWCQYEALKYVSFPTQVLSKSCKVLSVVAMTRIVSNRRPATYDLLSAAIIAVGMLLFLADSHHATTSAVGTASGLMLLALYLCCDSFTSSWQDALFSRYQVSPVQMLCYVNMFSCVLTATSLLQQPTTADSISMLQYPSFAADVALLAISSCVGQLLIYYTIAHFGALVFSIIMTLRQAVSILLSCVVYGHALSARGVGGVSVVLAAVMFRLYCRQRAKRLRKPDSVSPK